MHINPLLSTGKTSAAIDAALEAVRKHWIENELKAKAADGGASTPQRPGRLTTDATADRTAKPLPAQPTSLRRSRAGDVPRQTSLQAVQEDDAAEPAQPEDLYNVTTA